MDQDKNRRKQPQTIKRDPFDGWMDGRILQKLDQRDQVIHERRPPKPEKGRTRGTRWYGTPAAHLYCICTIMDHAIMPCRVRRKSGTTCGSENMSCGVTRPRPRPRPRDRDRETETETGTETEKTDVIIHRTTLIRTTAAPRRPEGPSPCPSWHTVIHDMRIVSAQSAVHLSA
jgi:hypothetical protein